MHSELIAEFANVIIAVEDDTERDFVCQGIGEIIAKMGGDFDWDIWRAWCGVN